MQLTALESSVAPAPARDGNDSYMCVVCMFDVIGLSGWLPDSATFRRPPSSSLTVSLFDI